MTVVIKSRLLVAERSVPMISTMSTYLRLPNLHVQLTSLFWIPDLYFQIPTEHYYLDIPQIPQSAYSKPSSSFPQTWSFCCTFHFNKRLHIPFTQQRLSSYSPSLSSPILFSWSRPPLSTNPSFQVLLISRTDTCSALCFSHVFLQFIFTTGSQPGWFCLLEDTWQCL